MNDRNTIITDVFTEITVIFDQNDRYIAELTFIFNQNDQCLIKMTVDFDGELPVILQINRSSWSKITVKLVLILQNKTLKYTKMAVI